ncbi:hypothetical protein ACFLUT_01085 [Chloroflexota bacterium]
MRRIEIEPELGRCVETAARQRHRRLVESMLQSGNVSVELAQEADLLRVFLEAADFPRLRAQSETLMAEGRRVVFEIVDDGGRVTWEMQER